MKIHAYAALAARAELTPFTYTAAPLGPFDILIKISHCGLCHSDVHLIDDNWKRSKYPLVPGHEIVGTITQKGDAVTLKVGTRVGIGWNHSACLSCPTCLQG
ncbi:MAG TPA: alcohol dehydrogenase catalytic domain-containing protein, partial [Chlamydiales bacterium]|nr:alcohol dehydrogenase catalytic domain-containing protein [Chlamydiales bacterium]